MKKIISLILIIFLSSFSFSYASEFDDLKKKGDNLVVKKQYAQAAECYEKLLKMKESHVIANNLGFIYAEMHDYSKALELYNKALSIKPGYKDAENNILALSANYAQHLIEKGKYENAIKMLSKIKKQFPNAGELYYFSGVAYQAMDRLPEAVTEWRKSAKINPNSSIAIYLKALEEIMAGNNEKAIKTLYSALEKSPNNVYARNMLGLLQAKRGNIEAAETQFKKITEQRPNYVEAYLNLGYLAEQKGDTQSAMNYYKTANVKNPYSIKAAINMGKIYQKMGRYFDAESCIKKASRVFPFSGELHRLLAITYANEKKFAEAIGEFNTAIGINPNDGEALYAIGLIYARSDSEEDKNKAIEYLNKCAQLPNSPYAPYAVEKLNSMNVSTSASIASPSIQNTDIIAESPDGDISMSIPSEWTEVPQQNDSDDKYMWVMSNFEKGIMFIVYKPMTGRGSDESSAKREAEKIIGKISSKQTNNATFNGTKYSVIEGKTQSNKIRKVFSFANSGKIYLLVAEFPKPENISDIDKLMNSVKIK